MADTCCSPPIPGADPRYRVVLWIALVLNATMFAVEVIGSVHSDSVSLLADAIDFLADAGNYAISLAVLGLSAGSRARAALVKAGSMAAFGVFVLARASWNAAQGTVPEPLTMGLVAALALAVNIGVAVLLYRWRAGDANMRSVWICSRNDALGNVAVGVAAIAVSGTGQGWPDPVVAFGLALLALSGAWSVTRQARAELAASGI